MAKNKGSSIHFFASDETLPLKNRGKLKTFLEQLFRKEDKGLFSLTYIFCSDKILLKMNQKYLGHNFYTDVLSFDLSVHPDEIIGDIYISVDRVRQNSLNYQTSMSRELHRVIFHGALHLCGYRDKTKNERATIRKVENKYLQLYFGVSRRTVS